MKKILLTTAILLAGTSITACTSTNTAANLPEGEYEKTTTTTDAAGTSYKTTTKTNVDEDSNGHRTATVKTKTTKDPKGLFNKSSTESKTTIKK